jgi:hypothetical protein
VGWATTVTRSAPRLSCPNEALAHLQTTRGLARSDTRHPLSCPARCPGRAAARESAKPHSMPRTQAGDWTSAKKRTTSGLGMARRGSFRHENARGTMLPATQRASCLRLCTLPYTFMGVMSRKLLAGSAGSPPEASGHNMYMRTFRICRMACPSHPAPCSPETGLAARSECAVTGER